MKKTEFISISPDDFKFTEFTNEALPAIPSDFSSDEWVKKLQELDAVVHREGMDGKITFSDDRLILVAFKTLSLTGIFEKGAGLMHWWITHRYVTLFMVTAPNQKELIAFIEAYILKNFLAVELDEEAEKNFIANADILFGIPFDEMPVFVMDAFEEVKSGKKRRTVKTKEKEVEVVEEVDWLTEESEEETQTAESLGLTEEEFNEWLAYESSSKIMLDGELSKEEREEWEQLLAGAEIMLGRKK